MALSTSPYLQFLDADDLLRPEKLARQAAFIDASGADVVYGDWQHQHHASDGSVTLGGVVRSRAHPDMLDALLVGWMVSPAAVLFRRTALDAIGGWDERLRAAQDHDLLIALAMAGRTFAYQAGCHSIYRRYGAVTVSSSDYGQWLESHCYIAAKALASLRRSAGLTAHRTAMANYYFRLARLYYDVSRLRSREMLACVLEIDPGFTPSRESASYRRTWRWFGFGAAEALASWKRRLVRKGASRPAGAALSRVVATSR